MKTFKEFYQEKGYWQKKGEDILGDIKSGMSQSWSDISPEVKLKNQSYYNRISSTSSKGTKARYVATKNPKKNDRLEVYIRNLDNVTAKAIYYTIVKDLIPNGFIKKYAEHINIAKKSLKIEEEKLQKKLIPVKWDHNYHGLIIYFSPYKNPQQTQNQPQQPQNHPQQPQN